MDKKSKKILMHYMDDVKRNLLSSEEIAYAKEHGAIFEDLPITQKKLYACYHRVLDLFLLPKPPILFYIAYPLVIWTTDIFWRRMFTL